MLGFLSEGGGGRAGARALVRRLATTTWGRASLNRLHLALGWRGQRRFYLLFAKIFRDGEPAGFAPGAWQIYFAGRHLEIPLRPGHAWLDWDSALSFLGNDQDVKQTYVNLLGSQLRPDVFVDVGANYGSHSLLMLAAKVSTVSFEPNPACHERLRAWGKANGLEPLIEACALGDRDGKIAFAFPERDTWLGHVVEDDGEDAAGLTRIEVPMRKLDEMADAIPPGRALIKLDAEGAEPLILAGASAFIAARRPMIVFECWPDAIARARFLAALPREYAIHALPWSPDSTDDALGPEVFERSSATNFIAVPPSLD